MREQRGAELQHYKYNFIMLLCSYSSSYCQIISWVDMVYSCQRSRGKDAFHHKVMVLLWQRVCHDFWSMPLANNNFYHSRSDCSLQIEMRVKVFNAKIS